jgi:glycosyltransferase involved in cell wall biosynthesis
VANPFFSIVVPVFNRAQSLTDTLDSIISQNWKSYEVIIVDDGSTDNIDAVVEKYAQHGFTFLRNKVNAGVGYTRNKGVYAAGGEWVIFLDSDNRLLPGGLSALHSKIAECDRKVAVVYGKSELIGVDERLRDSGASPVRWAYREYLQANQVQEALPVTRREVLLRFPFEENLGIKRECGLLVWYAIARAGHEFVWTRETVQQYKISPDSLSGKRFLIDHPEEMVICNQKIIERFGDDIASVNRSKLVALHQKTAFYCLMANCRRCALKHAQLALKFDRTNLRSWMLVLLCWMGPRTAQKLYPVAALVGA